MVQETLQIVAMDRFSALFDHAAPTARTFFTGNLCAVAEFAEREPGAGLGYLHILRAGEVVLTRPRAAAITLGEPTLILLPRPGRHRLEAGAGSGADLVCAMVDLGAGSGSPLALGLPEVIVTPLAGLAALGRTLALLVDEAFAAQDGRQASLDRLFEYVLIQLMRHLTEKGAMTGGALAALADPGLARATTAMHEAPARAWTLDDLAALAGMSRSRFAQAFRTTVGQTPMEYLTLWRVAVARKLLRQGKPVKTVAAAVGYDSAAAFTRVFTKIEGASPRVWVSSKS